jgi:hypothetical protein
MLVSFQGTGASCAGETTSQKANVQKGWKGLAGNWRRRDMTKSRLAYVVCDARRTVNREQNLTMKPEQRLGRFQCLQIMKNPVLRLPVRENVFGSQPHPIPVTRQLPRNHPSLPVQGRRAWGATGRVRQTGRSSRWSDVHLGNTGKPCTGRRTRDIAIQ